MKINEIKRPIHYDRYGRPTYGVIYEDVPCDLRHDDIFARRLNEDYVDVDATLTTPREYEIKKYDVARFKVGISWQEYLIFAVEESNSSPGQNVYLLERIER